MAVDLGGNSVWFSKQQDPFGVMDDILPCVGLTVKAILCVTPTPLKALWAMSRGHKAQLRVGYTRHHSFKVHFT